MHKPDLKPILKNRFAPALMILVIAAVVLGIVIWQGGGDPLVLARIGTQFSELDSQGEPGYDGQFVYYIACNPHPESVAPHLDVPAYRYQRILLPLLARWLAFGKEGLIPWALPVIGLISLALGTWAVSELLAGWGASRWYALVYGLYAGFMLALIVDLPEPLAYGLVAWAALAHERGRKFAAWILLGLALFAKEITALFLIAWLLAYLSNQKWKDLLGLALIAGLPFVIFQVWLQFTFGGFGIGSGGAMSTPFEMIPFMGLWRIGEHSMIYLLAMLAVFGPAVGLPSVWGTVRAARRWLAGERNWIVAGLFIHAFTIAFTPFSTFRETGGMIRFACGLVLALLLFAGRYGYRRALNYSVLWIVLNLFLIK